MTRRHARMTLERDGHLRAGFRQQAAVQRGLFPPQLVVARKFPQLHPPQRRADFVNAVVVSQVHHIVTPGVTLVTVPGQAGHAVRAQEAQPLRQAVVVRHQHPAFAGGHVLVGKETITADRSPRSQHAPVQFRTDGMSGVFDDRQPVPFCQVKDGGHVAGVAAIVHHQDGARAQRDARLDGLRRDVQVVFTADVGEDGNGSGVANGVGCSDKRQRGKNRFVSRTQACRYTSEMQRRCGIGHRNRMTRAGIRREFALELLRHRAHRQPAALHHLPHGFFFFAVEINVRKRHAPIHNHSSGRNCSRMLAKSSAAWA